jgi:hypothetical protein
MTMREAAPPPVWTTPKTRRFGSGRRHQAVLLACRRCGEEYLTTAINPGFCSDECRAKPRTSWEPKKGYETEKQMYLRVTTPCPECGKRGPTRLLATHRELEHGVCAAERRGEGERS